MSTSCPPSNDASSSMVRNALDSAAPPLVPQPWHAPNASRSRGDAAATATILGRPWSVASSPPPNRRTNSDNSLSRSPPTLSDRDSIFATTYDLRDGRENNPAGSSESHPAYAGALNGTVSQQPIAPAMSTGPRSLSPLSDIARRSTLAELFSAPEAPNTPQSVLFESLSHGPHRNDSDLLKRVKNLEKRQHITKGNLGERSPAAYPMTMSRQWWEETSTPSAGDTVRPALSEASGSNILETRKGLQRTSSKGHGKQRIEATLASDEPLANARSRKASHYLGLFKENAAAQDSRKQSEKGDKDIGAPRDGRTEPRSPRSPRSSTVKEHHTPALVENSSATTHAYQATKITKTIAESIETESQDDTDTPITPRMDAIADSRSRGLTPGRSPNPGESIEWRSSTPSGGSMPLRLLEEIRSRPKLGAAEQVDRESRDRKQVAKSSRPAAEQSIARRVHVSSGASSRSPEAKDSGEEDEDAEYESDKEHISSATYFPHQAPSPEGSEGGPEDEQMPKLDLDAEQMPPQTIRIDAAVHEILPESQHSAKALQSKATVRSIQQTFERANTQANWRESAHAISYASGSEWSKSDTENDSTDDTLWSDNESAHASAERGDATPTVGASSSVTQYVPRMRRAPLGAVELRPYKHQVGGHTKVFSFSRQAICKQLNNRENEFYEVVERNHPELLKFLPKYLGVLNVTYQKAPRRKKKSDIANQNPPPNKISDQSAKAFLNSAQSGNTGDQSTESSSHHRPYSVPRAISHSLNFDAQDDAIPQVIYANNMHMIPTNLFPTSPPHSHIRSIASSAPESKLSTNSREAPKQADFFSLPRDSSSAWPQSPSWGATTVNTKFKDTVLREVFSPPIVHQRKRHGYPRREHGQHLRGHSHLPQLAYPEDTGAPLARSVTPDLASRRGPFQPPPRVRSQLLETPSDVASSNPKPHSQLTEASLARFENITSVKSDSSETSHADTRVIGRRRSGGNLRRGQIGIDNNKRSEFKYYEDEDILADDVGKQADPSDVLGSRAPSAASSHATDSHSAHGRESKPVKVESEVADIAATLQPPISLAAPLNPLQAQQQPDKQVRHFLLLEDLTANMSRPCVIDLKMGTRQYGIEASKQKQASQRQKCKTTTSQQLGVRVCGMQVWNAYRADYVFEDKYAGRDVKPGRDFQNALVRFLYDGGSDASITRHIPPLLEKLSKLETMILKLPGYRFYASSLLMLYDGAYSPSSTRVNGKSTSNRPNGGQSLPVEDAAAPRSDIEIRLVDFANCVTAEDDLPESTPCPPHDRHGVDRGYIRGLRSLRLYLQRIWKEIEESEWVERGEADGMGIGRKGAGSGIGLSQPDNWKESDDDLGMVSI